MPHALRSASFVVPFLLQDIAAAQNSGRILATDGLGALDPVSAQTGWRSSWHLATKGNFDGSGNEDLLIYDRVAGEGRFMAVSAAGAFSTISLQTGWSTTWDQLVAGGIRRAAG